MRVNTGRDLRIDSLRGLALCLITLAHLDFASLQWVWDSLGHSSFAELFVFMSGLVSGVVYWKMLCRSSEREVWKKASARARLIYFTYLGLVVYIAIYIRVVQSLGIQFSPWGCRPLIEDPAVAFALAPLLIYQPGFANILPMYCVFMLLVPIVLPQIRRGRDWLVLLLSLGLWIAAQEGAFRVLFWPFVERFDIPPIYFDLFAWQILFVFGLWFGARLTEGRPVRLPQSPAFAWALIPPVLLSFAIRHEIFFDASVAEAAVKMTPRHDLAPLRLLNFAALAYLAARLAVWRPAWFEWRWLAYLGQHSLQVFTFSVAAVYFAQLFGRDADVPGQLVTTALALASLTLPAWVHVRYRARRAAAGA
jgi:hypothetical protein